jgi:hypothetical protein
MTKCSALLFFAVVLNGWNSKASDSAPVSTSPVLIELFTSEGCSSCPPADALLERLDRSDEIPGTQLVVLSEHVDYWNHDGWKDPYSSSKLTERQSLYASRFRLASAYTPQMVVDGNTEFVGNSGTSVRQAIEKACVIPKVPVTISAVSLQDAGTLTAHVETGPWPDSAGASKADVFVVVALNQAESQVLRGENKGRRLTHVAVVQSLTKIGTAEKGKPLAQYVYVKLSPGTDPANLRVIAFLQKSGPGPVLGVAMRRVEK